MLFSWRILYYSLDKITYYRILNVLIYNLSSIIYLKQMAHKPTWYDTAR
jgi:hypothetical protein